MCGYLFLTIQNDNEGNNNAPMVWANNNSPPDGTSISYHFRRTVCHGCSWLMMTSIQDTMFPLVGTPVDLSTPKGP